MTCQTFSDAFITLPAPAALQRFLIGSVTVPNHKP
jgi:hypothetical protein